MRSLRMGRCLTWTCPRTIIRRLFRHGIPDALSEHDLLACSETGSCNPHISFQSFRISLKRLTAEPYNVQPLCNSYSACRENQSHTQHHGMITQTTSLIKDLGCQLSSRRDGTSGSTRIRSMIETSLARFTPFSISSVGHPYHGT